MLSGVKQCYVTNGQCWKMKMLESQALYSFVVCYACFVSDVSYFLNDGDKKKKILCVSNHLTPSTKPSYQMEALDPFIG